MRWNSVSEHVVGTKRETEVNAEPDRVGQRRALRRPEDEIPTRSSTTGSSRQSEPASLFNEAETGAISTMTAIMGRMATYSGKVVSWDEASVRRSAGPRPLRFLDATPPVLPTARTAFYPCAVPGVTKAV